MYKNSKPLFASLLLGAVFNFNAYSAPVNPVKEITQKTAEDNLLNEIYNGRLDKAHALIAQGANPFHDEWLSNAVRYNREDRLAFLLSLETETQKWSVEALNHALRGGIFWGFKNDKATPAIKLFLKQRGDAIGQETKDIFLLVAVRHGDIETVQDVRSHGGNILSNGNAPLRAAAEMGLLPMVKYLMENGANALDENDCFCGGKNALMEAAGKNHVDILKYMVEEKKIAVNQTDKDGKIYSGALIRAFWGGHAEAAEFLLVHGAEFKSLERSNGVLTGAIQENRWDVVRVALLHGMDVTNAYNDIRQDDRLADELRQLQKIMADLNIPLPKSTTVSVPAPVFQL